MQTQASMCRNVTRSQTAEIKWMAAWLTTRGHAVRALCGCGWMQCEHDWPFTVALIVFAAVWFLLGLAYLFRERVCRVCRTTSTADKAASRATDAEKGGDGP